MPTYEEKIREFAADMSSNSTKILLDLDDETFLGVVVKDCLSKINGVRNVPTITTPTYIVETNTFLINISSLDSDSEQINIPIQLGDKRLEATLINLANGLGHIDIYYSSNDLSVIWATQLLRDAIGRLSIKRILEQANLI